MAVWYAILCCMAGQSRGKWAVWSPLRLALIMLGLAFTIVTLAILAAVALVDPQQGAALVEVSVVALLYAWAGVLAWWQRPASRMGAVMLGGAALWLLALLGSTRPLHLAVLGTVFETTPSPAFI